MPAGTINVTLPDPAGPRGRPKIVFFEKAPKLPKVPALGASWERAAKELGEAFKGGGARGALAVLRSGGTGAALGRTALTVAKGVGGILAAEITAKAAARFVVLALAQTQIPEVARLNRGLGLLAGAVAGGIESTVIPAIQQLGPILRAVERVPGSAMAVTAVTDAALRVMTDAVRVAILEGVVPRTRAVILARFPTTAGLERGGSSIVVPPVSGGSQIPGLPDVAISIPGGLSFTEPQNVIAEDPLPAPRLPLTAVAAGEAASAYFPTLRPLVARALDALEAQTRQSVAAARGDLSRSQGALGLAMSDPRLDLGRVDFSAGASGAVVAGAASSAIVRAPLWGSLVAQSDAINANLEAGMGDALGNALRATKEFATGFGGAQAQSLGAVTLASTELNDALELDMKLIQQVTASSTRAAKVQQAIQMAALVTIAVVRASIATTKGIIASIGGSPAQAAMHFTAAGLYGAAAALAISYGGSGGSRPRAEGPETSAPAGVTELVVIVPGYADPDRIREEVARALQGPADGGRGMAGQNVRHFTASELQALRAQYERAIQRAGVGLAGSATAQYAAVAWLGYAIPALGALGYLAGVALDSAFGQQIGGEARRFGRRLRRIF